jgi:hypothetical protein
MTPAVWFGKGETAARSGFERKRNAAFHRTALSSAWSIRQESRAGKSLRRIPRPRRREAAGIDRRDVGPGIRIWSVVAATKGWGEKGGVAPALRALDPAC